jgi:hypothetical protein
MHHASWSEPVCASHQSDTMDRDGPGGVCPNATERLNHIIAPTEIHNLEAVVRSTLSVFVVADRSGRPGTALLGARVVRRRSIAHVTARRRA